MFGCYERPKCVSRFVLCLQKLANTAKWPHCNTLVHNGVVFDVCCSYGQYRTDGKETAMPGSRHIATGSCQLTLDFLCLFTIFLVEQLIKQRDTISVFGSLHKPSEQALNFEVIYLFIYRSIHTNTQGNLLFAALE